MAFEPVLNMAAFVMKIIICLSVTISNELMCTMLCIRRKSLLYCIVLYCIVLYCIVL